MCSASSVVNVVLPRNYHCRNRNSKRPKYGPKNKNEQSTTRCSPNTKCPKKPEPNRPQPDPKPPIPRHPTRRAKHRHAKHCPKPPLILSPPFSHSPANTIHPLLLFCIRITNPPTADLLLDPFVKLFLTKQRDIKVCDIKIGLHGSR